MGLYNFKKRFVPFILEGSKTHTIRAKRKYPDKPGNMLHLYTGLRTRHTQLLMRVPCAKVEDIRIVGEMSDFRIFINGNELDIGEREALAKRDGFVNCTEMAAFWNDRLPFNGDVVHWRHPELTTLQ